MAAEGVENVGGPGEVEHHLGRARVLHTINLSTVHAYTYYAPTKWTAQVLFFQYIQDTTRCSVRPIHACQ